MANAVIMPKAGITVESCIIGEWKVKVGDAVNVGDILFTYETDKASFECESTAAGTLLEIFFEEGDEVPCLQNVCAVGTPGEDVSALKGGAASTDAPAAAAEAPAAAAAPAAPAAPVPVQPAPTPKADENDFEITAEELAGIEFIPTAQRMQTVSHGGTVKGGKVNF